MSNNNTNIEDTNKEVINSSETQVEVNDKQFTVKTEIVEDANVIAEVNKPVAIKTKSNTPLNTEDKSREIKPLSSSEKQELIETEKLFNEGMAYVRDYIAPSSMDISIDHMEIDGMYSRSMFVYAYPRFLETNWLSPVINLDVTMDVSMYIYPMETSNIMKVLRRKVTEMQSRMHMEATQGKIRDPGLEASLEDAERLRDQLQRGQEKFFHYALYFTIYAENMDKLEKVSKQLESLLGGHLVLTKRAQVRQEQAFLSNLPIAYDNLDVSWNMNTSPLSSTFPFTSSDLTSNDGILYGVNRHNDSLIIFDRFSLENANSVVFAKSGAGKSYAVKLEILRSLMMGTQVIVIDPENEYQSLAETVGGTYMKVSLNSDRRINPFDLPRPFEGDDVKPGDLLRSNIISLLGLLKLMLGGLTPSEDGIMDKALIEVYSLKGITMDLLDPSVYEPPTMEDLESVLKGMIGAESIVQRLQKFTNGTYSGVFNKPTNIEMDSNLVVYSIRDLEEELRPIAMYIILNFIWSKVRSSLERRMLVVDEAWIMMKHRDSAEFLFGLVKRARKYYLGVTTITQDVEDFVKSDFGKPIITNSSMQLLLKQSPSAMDSLSKVFNLTQGEKYMLLNSGVGQGLFFAGLKHVAIQIIASYTEDKIITTDPRDKLS